jgi:hypothetical protein
MDQVHDDFRAPDYQLSTELNEALLAPACPAERHSWEHLTAQATLVLPTNGGSIRSIITGRRIITTGVYASRKSGRAHPYESMNERAFFMHCEVDTNIVDYRAQPFRFEFVLGGTKRTYIADAVVLLADGTVEAIEIKNDRRFLQDPDYQLKLNAVADICKQVGWSFRIFLKEALFTPSTRWQAIEDIQSWAFTAYTTADVYQVAQYLYRRGSRELGEVADCLGRRALGIAKLKAMMVARIVDMDLSKPLNNQTRVTLITDGMGELA